MRRVGRGGSRQGVNTLFRKGDVITKVFAFFARDIKSCFHLAMWKNFLSEALDENDGEIVGKNLQEKYKKVSALTMEKILEFVQVNSISKIAKDFI